MALMGEFYEIRDGFMVSNGVKGVRINLAPDGFPYGFYMRVWGNRLDCYAECVRWSSEQFEAKDRWGRWFEHAGTFWFRDEIDAMTFKMRWL